MAEYLDTPVTYKNPWHDPKKYPLYGPAEYEADAKPEEYRGYLIYHRVRSGRPISDGADCFDVVKDGVCLTQCAGPNGARRAIDIGALWGRD